MTAPSHQEIEASIVEILREKGPRLGKELALDVNASSLQLWQACYTSQQLFTSHFASYYLRYDISRANLIRLSPSILRDFLSFTLFSLPGQRDQLIERQGALSNLHREISLEKLTIAQQVVNNLLLAIPADAASSICMFVAGDLAYHLAHNEPREHAATGEMIRGSDIDIVVLHDGLSDEVLAMIDTQMQAMKNFYLRHPDHRHELDYIVKTKEKMIGQMRYNDIHDKIASKICYESVFLGGSLDFYMSIRNALKTSGVVKLIEADFETALLNRKKVMKRLLEFDGEQLDAEMRSLFYFSQERVEFT
jgi:hypothetical protein